MKGFMFLELLAGATGISKYALKVDWSPDAGKSWIPLETFESLGEMDMTSVVGTVKFR
jgi:hypothetical protein